MKIKIQMPQDVTYIIDTLYRNGFEAFAVGGCVRDALLGRAPNDWDITTSAKPEQVKELFRRTIDTGILHGTVTVMLGSEGYEVTTYRIDGEYLDSRHPKEVIFTPNLVEDLKRRDFTINAMAYNNREGLVDAFDGIGDLEKQMIRCVGKAEERFSEDALRMLRAVRFAAQLGFSIDDDTKAAVRKLAPTIAKVSAERIQMEMIKLLVSGHPEEIRTAYELGLTKIFLPEFDTMMETPQHNIHHFGSVGEHTLKVLQEIPGERILRLAALLHDVAKPMTKTTEKDGTDHFYLHPVEGEKLAQTILRRWKLDNDTIRLCCLLVRRHDDRPALSPVNVRRVMNRVGSENIPLLLALNRADVRGQSMYQREEKLAYYDRFEEIYQEIQKKGQCVDKKNLAISGNDLIALGIRPGKQMGAILEELFQLVLDDPDMNEKDKLLNTVLTKFMNQ